MSVTKKPQTFANTCLRRIIGVRRPDTILSVELRWRIGLLVVDSMRKQQIQNGRRMERPKRVTQNKGERVQAFREVVSANSER